MSVFFSVNESVPYPVVPEGLPLYHPDSPCANKSGYYPNINEEQLRCVNSLKILIDSEGLEFSDDEVEFFKLLRFLRARKFNVEQAMAMIRADCHWRRDVVGYDLILEDAQDVLGCDLARVYQYFPTWLQGFDKQHRPVSYRQFGKFEIWQILQLTSFQSLVRFHAWESEMAIRQMFSKSREMGINVETFVCVVDAQGWGVRLATSDAFAFIKSMADTDAAHYPERLGRLIVINAPFALSWAWSIIVTFLDEVTKAKISIYLSESSWKPVLFDLVDKSSVPNMYGGDAPDPQGASAILDMNPPEKSKIGKILRRPLQLSNMSMSTDSAKSESEIETTTTTTTTTISSSQSNASESNVGTSSKSPSQARRTVDAKDCCTQTEESYFFYPPDHYKYQHTTLKPRVRKQRLSIFGFK